MCFVLCGLYVFCVGCVLCLLDVCFVCVGYVCRTQLHE
jgi:hypothetical protein